MAPKPKKHVVVVDGSNLATEGRTLPSLGQLDEAVRAYSEEDPEAEIVVVVDASFEHRIDASERAQLVEAELHGEVVSPPAGAIGRGDAFVLRIAERTGARVLSNDSFQEFHAEHPWLFDDGRLVGGKPVPGIGWIFTPRLPVRGPKSRQVTGKARRATEALSPPVKAAELAKAAKKAAARKLPALPPGVTPKVGDVWTALAAVNGHEPGPAGPVAGRAKKVAKNAVSAAKEPGSKKVGEKKAGAKKAGAKKASAREVAPAKATAKKTAAKQAAAKRTAAKKTAPAKAAAKRTGPEHVAGSVLAEPLATSETITPVAHTAGGASEAAAGVPPVPQPGPTAGEGGAAKKDGAKKAAAKASAAEKAPAKKSSAGKAIAKRVAPEERGTKKAVEKKGAARKAPAHKAAPAAGNKKPSQAASAMSNDGSRSLAGRTAREDPAVRVAIDEAMAEVLRPPSPPVDTKKGGSKKAKEEAGKDDAAKGKRRRRRSGSPPPAVNEPLAFITFVAAYPLQSEIEGEVVSFTSHGAMVDVDLPGGGLLHCYIPLTAMGDPPPAKARQVLARGEHRRFVLVGLDPPRRVAELALADAPVAVGSGA